MDTELYKYVDRPVLLELLIKAGADLDAIDPFPYTPLHAAVRRGNLKSVRLLLDAGVDPHTTPYEREGFCLAADDSGDRLEITELLLSRGFTLRNPLVYLYSAIGREDIAMTKLLLRYGVWSPAVFLCASKCDCIEIVKILLEHDAYNQSLLDVQDDQGGTALHHALRLGNYEVAELLVKSGASMSIYDTEGLVALHYAVISSGNRIVKVLLDHGADRNMRTRNKGRWGEAGQTALDLARRLSRERAIGILSDT